MQAVKPFPMIEKRRHKNIDRNIRRLFFCPDSAEDEMHFLFKVQVFQIPEEHSVRNCHAAGNARKMLEFSTKSDMEKFKILLTDIRTLPLTYAERPDTDVPCQ